MHEFVHPDELTAWNKLSENKLFQNVVGLFQSLYSDLTAFSALKGRNFAVTEATLPAVYGLYATAGERLGIAALPPLYLQTDYGLQISTVGTDNDCAVVLSSACLEECDDAQLLALFGQELTHVRYRHLRMLNMIPLLDNILAKLPKVGNATAQTFKTLLLQWKEAACYTADRGAAIAAGGKDAVYRNLTHAMGMMLDADGVEALVDGSGAGKGASAAENLAARVVMQTMMSGIHVPFGNWRIRELHAWPDAEFEQASLYAGFMVKQEDDSKLRKTVDTVDAVAKGIFRGTMKTAEVVKERKGDVEDYVAANSPIWKQNIKDATMKTAETVRDRSEELSDYLKEKSPEWKESASELLQAGGKRLSDLKKSYRSRQQKKR